MSDDTLSAPRLASFLLGNFSDFTVTYCPTHDGYRLTAVKGDLISELQTVGKSATAQSNTTKWQGRSAIVPINSQSDALEFFARSLT